MNLVEAAILGLVEGITEYLPVSSTGHLILTSALLYGSDQTPEQKNAVDTFEIVIQGGAILAVLGLYWPRVLQMIRGLLGKDTSGLHLLGNLVVAFIPSAILGLLLHDWIETNLFHPAPVLAALAMGGLLMIMIGPWQRRRFHTESAIGSGQQSGHSFIDIDHVAWKHAAIIGMLQCLALWPGTSRSMVTIVGGMLVGLRPRHAAEFSFLLALPTLGAACAYSALKSLAGDGPDLVQSLGLVPIVVGLGVATISAALAVRFLVAFLNRHGLAVFGWYRLALCAGIGLMIWRGWIAAF